MTLLIHKFLENDERAQTTIATVGLSAGAVLLAVAVFATFGLR